METLLQMSTKELSRLEVIQRLSKKQMSQKEVDQFSIYRRASRPAIFEERILPLNERRPWRMTSILDNEESSEYNSTYIELFSREMPVSDVLSPPVNLQTLAERLKVLAEPKRLLIINLLMDGVQCNCELGDALQMAPNLISHHLSVLRQAGLVDVERDALDSRWVYYSVNRAALDKLNAAFGAFFDPARIQPRRLTCGPQTLVCAPGSEK